MRRFEIDRRGASAFERGFPAGNANTPAIARFQTGKTPVRHWRDQVVSIEHGEIEEFLGHLDAHNMQPDVFRPGAAISVAVKSRHRIATATAQFGAKNVGGHGDMLPKERRFPNRVLVVGVTLQKDNDGL